VGKSKNPVATGKILILKELQGKCGYFNPHLSFGHLPLIKGDGGFSPEGV